MEGLASFPGPFEDRPKNSVAFFFFQGITFTGRGYNSQLIEGTLFMVGCVNVQVHASYCLQLDVVGDSNSLGGVWQL